MSADVDERSVSAALRERVAAVIGSAGGWIPFSRYMEIALYEPGLGYYASGRPVFGRMPHSRGLAGPGSDFVTAPELSPLFGRALAAQVGEALDATGTDEIVEFGAGSGALAAQLLGALGARVRRYSIVELSAPLSERQREATAAFAPKLRWLDRWPDAVRGVVVGNEVLDAMPVDLIAFDGERWLDRGVAVGSGIAAQGGGESGDGPSFQWADRAGTAQAPLAAATYAAGTVTETHAQARAFIATLAAHLEHGAAFFIDYGFPEHEYYLPQRSGGTLACHRAHRVDFDPLEDTGLKDITAHVDFTGIALAAQDAGLDVAGYTSQARFLFGCGIAGLLADASARERADAQKLLNEHEMGELFKAIAFTRGIGSYAPMGFASGDRRHRL